jgi:hypothetical protein
MPARAIDKHQDLPVILHNDQRGLLTIEDGRLDVLQLSKDGRRELPDPFSKRDRSSLTSSKAAPHVLGPQPLACTARQYPAPEDRASPARYPHSARERELAQAVDNARPGRGGEYEGGAIVVGDSYGSGICG